LVVDFAQCAGRHRGWLVVRGDGRHRVAAGADLFAEDRLLAPERGLRRVEAMEHAAHSGERFGLLRIDPAHARPGIGAPKHANVEHAREVDVLRVASAAGDALLAVDAAARLRDLAELGVCRRDRKILAFDADERLGELAPKLLAALDDTRHQAFLFPADTP